MWIKSLRTHRRHRCLFVRPYIRLGLSRELNAPCEYAVLTRFFAGVRSLRSTMCFYMCQKVCNLSTILYRSATLVPFSSFVTVYAVCYMVICMVHGFRSMRQYFQHPRQPPFHLSDGRVEEPSSSHLPSQPSFKSVVVTFACFCIFFYVY